MRSRCARINPLLLGPCNEEFVEQDNLDRLIDGRLDYVDCIDAYRTRLH